jgi:hypothetical protein
MGAHPEIDPKNCDIRYMKNPVSLNGTKNASSAPRACQARGCAKLGSLRSIFTDDVQKFRWTYFMCDEHSQLLTEQDKRFIARTEETKVA